MFAGQSFISVYLMNRNVSGITPCKRKNLTTLSAPKNMFNGQTQWRPLQEMTPCHQEYVERSKEQF